MIFLNYGIILIVVGIIGFITALYCGKWYDDMLGTVSCVLFMIGLIITMGYVIDKDITPTAMDVYRGKTTLEITYKDGVAIDSVVVFKERK